MASRRYSLIFYAAIIVALVSTFGVYHVLEVTKANATIPTGPVLVAQQDIPEGAAIDRVSVAVVDSGSFKGVHEVDNLRGRVETDLQKYVALARRLGWNSDYRIGHGIDSVAELTRLCLQLSRDFPRVVFFAGKLLWKREGWYQRLLHNETAYQVQRRLQWKGLPMTVLPLRVPE